MINIFKRIKNKLQIATSATKKIKGMIQALKMPTVWGDRHLRG